MLEELERRNYSEGTTRRYLRFVERFAQLFGKSPDKLGPDHLRSYQAYLLKEPKLCPGTVENHVAAPFGGPEHVLRYSGRYTHRMAISYHRLTAFDGKHVSFRWRDYAHGSKQRVMPLDAVEFLPRFRHVLPRVSCASALWPAVAAEVSEVSVASTGIDTSQADVSHWGAAVLSTGYDFIHRTGRKMGSGQKDNSQCIGILTLAPYAAQLA